MQTILIETVLLVGLLVLASLLVKAGMRRLRLPPEVAFIALGILIRGIDTFTPAALLGEGTEKVLRFLADLGVVVLMFRVGLHSNLKALTEKLGRASMVWVRDMTISGLVGFLGAYYLLNFDWIPSTVIAVALTATSVGVSVSVWQRTGNIDSDTGELLIDVAEMDDISGVVLMAMLFSVLPVLQQGGAGGDVAWSVLKTFGIFLSLFAGFVALCALFSKYFEKPLRCFFQRFEPAPDPMLTVIGIGIVLAAVAGLLHFSLAVGAFFAGLMFSRDPDSIKDERSFQVVCDLLVPFFFVGIGIHLHLTGLHQALLPGLVLIGLAAAGKYVATGLPLPPIRSWEGGALLGLSMIPRAEIAMIVMQKGLAKGPWAVPQKAYSSMVLVTLVTCSAIPPLLKWMISRYRPS